MSNFQFGYDFFNEMDMSDYGSKCKKNLGTEKRLSAKWLFGQKLRTFMHLIPNMYNVGFFFLLLFICIYYVVEHCSYKNSILILTYTHSTRLTLISFLCVVLKIIMLKSQALRFIFVSELSSLN